MSEKKMSEAQEKALKKYKANVKRLTVDFPPTDAELWEHIQKQPNKQGYIKALIRADIGKPKGRWLGEAGEWKCSCCGNYGFDGGWEASAFCPNCGADMELE
jgi:hypothetical protein